MTPGAESAIAAWARLGAAALVATGDLWTRSVEIGARHLAGSGASTSAQELPRSGIAGLRRFASELATAPWLALDRFSTELAAFCAPASPSRPVDARLIEGQTLRFPVRTMDASQGLAVYPVPLVRAQRCLDERLGHHFVAIDVGRHRAAVEVYVMDYRASDLGSYLEVGVGVWAAPRRDPLAIGLCVLDEPVNDHFACRAGIEAWGFPKTECALEVEVSDASCLWRARDPASGNLLLTLTLPRGGAGASVDVPLRLYTVMGGVPQLAAVRRTGFGERTRASGAGVALELPAAEDGHPLVQTLRALGVETAVPMLQGWTEHVRLEVGAPRTVAARAGRDAVA